MVSRRPQTQRGYTLIELVVVLLVTAILAAVALPHVVARRNRAREEVVRGHAHLVQRIVEGWAEDHDGRPPQLGDLEPGLFPGGVYPENPFTGEPLILGPPGFSPGNIGYTTAGGIYTIEGYGASRIVITLTNG